MNREKIHEEIDKKYSELEKERDGTLRSDGVPFMQIEGEYDLVAIYYAMFGRWLVITQVVKVLSSKHIKGCGSKYAMFKIFGDPVNGFEIDHHHASEETLEKLGIDELTFFHWYTNRKYKELKAASDLAQRPHTPLSYIEFKKGESRDKKIERFIQALDDAGIKGASAEAMPFKEAFK